MKGDLDNVFRYLRDARKRRANWWRRLLNWLRYK